MPPETLRVWLFDKEHSHLSHRARCNLSTSFDLRCPVPTELSIPERNGEEVKIYIRRFALIQGSKNGEEGRIIAVYYVEK